MKRTFFVFLSVLLLAQLNGLYADVLDPDLVLYFDFEEFNGNSVIEKSGRGYDGEINGKVTQSNDGKFGKAAEFTSGGFLDLDGPNINPDDIPTEGMSVVAWINVNAVTDMAISMLVHRTIRGWFIQRRVVMVITVG